MGSTTVPDRSLQRQKKPSVTLSFLSKLRHSHSLYGRESHAALRAPVVPAIHSK